MGRTEIRLGGVELGSTIMNASGVRSAERAEILELCASHSGAIVFKSCNIAGLDSPENLKNRGAEYFASIARELAATGRKIIGSAVGASEEEIVSVSQILDRAGVSIVEINLADDYVARRVAPFDSIERIKSILTHVRRRTKCGLAVKLPAHQPFAPRAVADLFKSVGVAIAVCANDVQKDLEIDTATGEVSGAPRMLSQAHAFHLASDGSLDVVAVGGINTGADAYIAHLAGAKTVQVGSVLIKEGIGALARIDRELDEFLARHGHKSVSEIIGRVRFVP
ncbi:MAG TPA: hypothetical protein VMU16_11525 [Candidatus Binataceae bacterium]|nr:hypothetical protein [Candidatus Binataceae bacterium]